MIWETSSCTGCFQDLLILQAVNSSERGIDLQQQAMLVALHRTPEHV
jgi:hypothetical protein